MAQPEGVRLHGRGQLIGKTFKAGRLSGPDVQQLESALLRRRQGGIMGTGCALSLGILGTARRRPRPDSCFIRRA